jgi:hypothetical protein
VSGSAQTSPSPKAADRLGLSYHQMRGLLRKYGYGRKGDGAEDETAAPPAR